MQSVHSNTYVLRLFRVIGENSLGVAFAGMQLALVAVIALLTVLLSRGRSNLQRIYLAAFGLLFFFLAREELNLRHSWLENTFHVYSLIGVIVVAATLSVALRSPRRTWIWYACLSIGLAIVAAGGLALDKFGYFSVCESLGLTYFDTFLDRDYCLLNYIEESLELVGGWLVLVAMLGLLSAEVVRPNRFLRWLLYALPVVLYVPCVAYSDPDIERVQRKILASPADVTFEPGVRLYGYQVERGGGGGGGG